MRSRATATKHCRRWPAQIVELDELTTEAEKSIEKHERGRANVASLDVEDEA